MELPGNSNSEVNPYHVRELTAKDLRDQFDLDLKNLQRDCLHSHIEEVENIPANGTIRICVHCEKVIGD